MRLPSSTPAGIFTVSVRVRSRRPRPRHVSHGVGRTILRRCISLQVLWVTNCPSGVWRTLRIAPEPPQRSQRCDERARLRARTRHVSQVGEMVERDLALGAAKRFLERDLQIVAQVGEPRCGPAGRCGRLGGRRRTCRRYR
jgi:hypothetical protein